jgi:hypothetical protein
MLPTSWNEAMLVRLNNITSRSDNHTDKLEEVVDKLLVLSNKADETITALDTIQGRLEGTIALKATGNSQVIMPPVPGTYTGWELTGVAAHLTTDSNSGDRSVSLELIGTDTDYPVVAGQRVIYAGYQSPTMPPNHTRHLFWAQNHSSDNWSRQPIASVQLQANSPYRWRLLSNYTVGAGDIIVATFFLKVH